MKLGPADRGPLVMAAAFLRLVLVLALCFHCIAADQAEYQPPPVEQPSPSPEGSLTEGQMLMTLKRAVTNWAEATSTVHGFSGWDWPYSKPCDGTSHLSSWTGVLCSPTSVKRVYLANLGLAGLLPPDLLLLPNLAALNLSRNSFTGTLPPQWSSQSLVTLDLSYNKLSGPLPVAYGVRGTFPKLLELRLQGNAFTGALPGQEWSTGFAPQVVITLRPGNAALCGPLPRIDASLFPALPAGSTPVGLPYARNSSANSSTSYMMYDGLFAATSAHPGSNGTSVLITNTLGSCADPCGRTVTVATNLFDVSWGNNVTISDLLRYNPGLTPNGAEVGTALALPCYPSNPVHLGSDMARGRFAGGNQHGVAGTVGAALAAAMVDEPTNSSAFYEGSREWAWEGMSGGLSEPVVEPVFWFVDLEANFSVSAVTVVAGNAMTGISLYIGSSAHDVMENAQVAQGQSWDAGQARVLTAGLAWGRYVILYAGERGQSVLSLARVQVWAAQSNAAFEKPTFSSASVDLNNTNDGQVTTCSVVTRGSDDRAWIAVDIGYEAQVAAVVLDLDGVAAGVTGDMYVTHDQSWRAAAPAALCAADVELHRDAASGRGHVATSCRQRGRYVLLEFNSTQSLQVCEVEVFLEDAPDVQQQQLLQIAAAPPPASVMGGVVGGAMGATVALAALAGAVGFVYIRRRRRVKGLALGSAGGSSEDAHTAESGGFKHDSPSSTNGEAGHRGLPGMASAGSMGKPHPSPRPSAAAGRSSRGDAAGLSSNTDLSRFGDRCDIVDYSRLELVRTIGEGSFGLVWMGRYLQTTVAVKLLTHDVKRGMERQERPSPAIMAALQREASIMASLRHPNCVQYLGACLDPPGLIMEYCSKRSVDCILAAAAADPKQAKQLNWVRLLNMATDAAKGMLYLHTRSPPIIHRDLKSPNLLVDALWHVKVSDFNLSRAVEQNAAVVSSLQITNPRWLAPEVLQGEAADAASDVFAFGVVLWELMTWQLPWGRDANPFVIINSVVAGRTLEVPPEGAAPAGPLECHAEYVALMRRCWDRDPRGRPCMDEVAQQLRGMLAQVVRSALRVESRGAEEGEAE